MPGVGLEQLYQLGEREVGRLPAVMYCVCSSIDCHKQPWSGFSSWGRGRCAVAQSRAATCAHSNCRHGQRSVALLMALPHTDDAPCSSLLPTCHLPCHPPATHPPALQELKLQAELRSGGGKQARAASTLDSFAADLPAYQGLARDAMARVRARLMGYDDDEQAAVGYWAVGSLPAFVAVCELVQPSRWHVPGAAAAALLMHARS